MNIDAAHMSATQPGMAEPSALPSCGVKYSAVASVATGGSRPRKVMALGASQRGVAASTSHCAQGDSTSQ